MLKSSLPIVATVALSVALPLAPAGTASAAPKAKKLTYEQAWAECKKDVTSVLGSEATTSAARYTRGAACMKQHGYRLKRSSVQ
jgi:hypothetical protein